MVINVCMVEDDAGLRESISRFIGDTAGFACVGAYASAEEALAGIPRQKPEVVLMDINLPGQNGIECVRQLKPQLPSTQFLMVTVHMDTDLIFQALAAGATGYLLKRSKRDEVLTAIREVNAGGSPMSRNIARLIVEAFQGVPPEAPEIERLTERELHVLRLLSGGLMYKEIADKLNVSFNTVHTLGRRIYEKLHVNSRKEAVDRFRKVAQPGRRG